MTVKTGIALAFFFLPLSADWALKVRSPHPGSGMIRVLLGKHSKAFVNLYGMYTIMTYGREREKILDKVKGPLSTKVYIGAGRNLYFRNKAYNGSLYLRAGGDDAYFKLGKIKYRGDLVLLRYGKIVFYINLLHMSRYLYGVLPSEIGHKWPKEAVKAQAIAARTYAYYQKLASSQSDLYDLNATTKSQVYRGKSVEQDETSFAVDRTQGLILEHEEAPILAQFHSACGGMTEDAKNVWGSPVSYLKSVKDPYCTNASRYRWGTDVALWRVRTVLKHKNLTNISFAGHYPSGRITQVILEGKKPKKVSAVLFRSRLGYDRIRSTRFTVKKKGNSFRIDGIGNGHGVGLCQWGSRGMAEAGMTYEEILHTFYSGVRITRYRVKGEWR